MSSQKPDQQGEDLRKAIEELREAVMDIRATLSELENPFNLLKSIDALNLGKPSSPSEGEKPPENRPEEKPSGGREAEHAPPPGEPVKPIKAKSVGFGFNLIKWAWVLMDAGMSKEDIISITRYCESVNYLPKDSSILVEYILDPMYKAKLGGLNDDEFMLIIYNAARAAGIDIRIESLEEMAFNLLRKILKKIDGEASSTR
jgi:hypothetical protein